MVELTHDIGDQAAEAGRQRMIHERKARGWTFDEFARRTDVARSTLSSICSGSDRLNLRVAVMVARGLGIGLDDLLNLDGYSAPKTHRAVTAGGRVDLSGIEGRAPIRVDVDLPELGLEAGDVVIVDTTLAPSVRKLVVVEDTEGVSRLYRVRSLDPMILERAAGPATVYDDRYHRIVAVGVSLFRDL